MFDLTATAHYLPQLLAGLFTTLWVSLTAIALGLVMGWAVCLGLMSERRWLRMFCAVYVSFFRGTPLLVQLVLVFYALPSIGISLPPLAAAIVALTLNSGAFQGEILRSGFQLLPYGQTEAARDLGLSRWQALIYIKTPQVLKAMLPALVNETIDIIKNSSLISAVAVHELMRTAQTLASTTYRPIEFFIVTGLLYLALTMATGREVPLIGIGLFDEYGGSILAGICVTLKMSIGGIALGMVLGLVLQSLYKPDNKPFAFLYQLYLNVFRGTPLLLQLFLVFYGGPYIGIEWTAETVGLIGLGLYGAAYFAEIFRAGRESIPQGQLEAARDLGLTGTQVFRVVLWPQMMARCVPAVVGQTIILLKESSVLSIITVAELTNVAMTIAVQSYSMLEPYTILALTYWAIAIVLAGIEIRDLQKSYGQHEVLKGISLTVAKGEVVSIIGGSGSGKSTLLRCINFLEEYDGGEVLVNNRLIGYGSSVTGGLYQLPENIIQSSLRKVCMVFQQFNLWPHMRVLDNIATPLRLVKKMPKLAAYAMAEAQLEKVSDKVVFLADGRVEEQGPPSQIFGAPTSPRLLQFLTSWNERQNGGSLLNVILCGVAFEHGSEDAEKCLDFLEPLRSANHVAGFQLCEWQILSLEGGTLNASSGIATETTRLDHAQLFNVLILCTAENIHSDTDYDDIRQRLDHWSTEPVDLGAFGGAGWLLAMSGALNGFRCSLPEIGYSQHLGIYKDIKFVTAPFCVDRGRLTCIGRQAVQGLMCEFLAQERKWYDPSGPNLIPDNRYEVAYRCRFKRQSPGPKLSIAKLVSVISLPPWPYPYPEIDRASMKICLGKDVIVNIMISANESHPSPILEAGLHI
eukprot:gene4427-5185_t